MNYKLQSTHFKDKHQIYNVSIGKGGDLENVYKQQIQDDNLQQKFQPVESISTQLLYIFKQPIGISKQISKDTERQELNPSKYIMNEFNKDG